VAHRKKDKEALRREREQREAEARAAAQRKQLVGFGAAGALTVAAVVVIVLLAGGGGNGDGSGPGGGGGVFPDGGEVSEQTAFDLQAAAEAAGCDPKSSKGTGVATHTTRLDEKVDYKENPPTNGRHYEIPAEDGLYQDAPPDEALVHALEHGRVIVWVKPNLPEEARQTIKALFDEDDYQMLVVPRRNMPYAVAATAWNRDPEPGGTGRTLGCERWSDQIVDALRTFRDEHRSNGPEPVP
jgi:hypothetical protein